ncbi:MAG: thiol reductant ABC exporter subunit CydD [Hyphomicrobiales bacterium]|nr:MAG: thiol reductant ABC exporter subunit CydD [Hyphomicrobiales bacterium]
MDSTRFLKDDAKTVKAPLRLAALLSFAAALLIIAQAFLLATIVTAVVFKDAGLADLTAPLAALPIVFLLRFAVTATATRTAFSAAATVKQALRQHLLSRITALGPVRLAGEGTGDLVTTLADGIEKLEAYFSGYLPAVSAAMIAPLVIVVVVAPNDWLSGLVLVVTAPLIPLFMILIGKGAERLNQRQWHRLTRMGNHFLDRIAGLATLKAFGASRREAATIGRIAEDYRQTTMGVLRVAFLSAFALEFFATISIAIVAVFIGFRLLFGEMTFLSGFFALLLAPEFYLPLRQLGTQYHARMDALAAADRIVEIATLEMPERPAATVVVPDRFTLRFDNVSFAHAGRDSGVSGLSFTMAPGERIALVGPSGAGKSTILQLVLRFIEPDSGMIFVDDTPLAAIDPDHWRRHLSYVPQAPTLFFGTIAGNIRLGMPDADTAALQEAMRAANVDEFTGRLPAGLDTDVGDRGADLSGGQVQRIALARALLKPATLMLFDEPTAHLDLASERLIADALAALPRDRTTLTIAHRLSSVRAADRILVVDRGQLIEQGRHDDLVAKGGLYSRLASAYARHGETKADEEARP